MSHINTHILVQETIIIASSCYTAVSTKQVGWHGNASIFYGGGSAHFEYQPGYWSLHHSFNGVL